MNAKAALIGAYSTKYTNPTGMHDDAMYTTARDTAQIAIYAQKNEDFARIVKTPKYVMEKTDLRQYRDIYNRNAMISKFTRRDTTTSAPWASTQEPPRPADIARCR